MSDKKPYDRIYLIGWYKEYPKPTDFGDEVTWCQNPIGEDDECPDIEYIRADLFEAQEKELEEYRTILGDFSEYYKGEGNVDN